MAERSAWADGYANGWICRSALKIPYVEASTDPSWELGLNCVNVESIGIILL
jgi:hypothetical protein